MTNRRHPFTKAEIARVLRAVKAEGWDDPELILHANGNVTVRKRHNAVESENSSGHDDTDLDKELAEYRAKNGYT